MQSQGKLSFCKACVQEKCHQKPHYSLKSLKSKEKLQSVHAGICGLMPTQSLGGSRYFITFTDDYCRTYFLKSKAEALEKFKEFKVSIETESGMKIKAMRA